MRPPFSWKLRIVNVTLNCDNATVLALLALPLLGKIFPGAIVYAKTHQKPLLNGLRTPCFALFVTRLSTRIRVHFAVLFTARCTHLTTRKVTRQVHGFCFAKAETALRSRVKSRKLITKIDLHPERPNPEQSKGVGSRRTCVSMVL